MHARALLTAPLVLALLAGCVSDDEGPVASPPAVLDLVASEAPLWNGPQDFPHPAYGYPTLTDPAVNGTVPRWWTPIKAAALPEPIRGIEPLSGTKADFDAGAGIALFGSLAVVPGFTGPTYIVDISDPAAPKVLSSIETVGRGAAIIPYPNGTLVFVMSTDAGIDTLYDITDPEHPVHIIDIQPKTGSHKVAVVPGTPILYNANSNGAAPGNTLDPQGISEIYDLSDPWDPVLVSDWANGYGCHHIYFHLQPSESYYRALCAGIEVTQIWDIADPLEPSIVVSIPVHHGDDETPSGAVSPLMFSHAATFNDDHTVLIVGDETGGGAAPGCDAYVDAGTGRAVSGPFGNLWFYDVTDEKDPKLLSWLSPNAPLVTDPPSGAPPTSTDPFGLAFGALFWTGAMCTAHHGRLIPDAERDLLAWAFYGAGVVIIDFTDPSTPRIVDEWNVGTNTWEVWYYNGYLFTGDQERGMDVLRIV